MESELLLDPMDWEPTTAHISLGGCGYDPDWRPAMPGGFVETPPRLGRKRTADEALLEVLPVQVFYSALIYS